MSAVFVYEGATARERLLDCLNSFFQDDAVGWAYVIRRGSPDAGPALAPLSSDSVDIGRLFQDDQLEMVVVDSGNTDGDSWKAVYFCRTQVLTFVRESD